MNLDRRAFLRGLSAASALPFIACGDETAGFGEQWLSAHGNGPFGVALLPRDGSDVLTLATDFRGHDLAQNPRRPEQVVMFGRRPGTRAFVLDPLRAAGTGGFGASPGRSMMGHGFFSPDGERIYTAEADNESGAGALVSRRADDWQIIEAIPTEGIGPHQAILLDDGDTAVVANGGILTRPESGREKLNLDTMRSTLTYISLESGTVIASETVRESKASIRHLEADSSGTVALGLQIQREAMESDTVVSLAGVHRLGEPIELFDDGLEVMGAMNDYVGSVAVASKSRVAGFTSPRGSVVAFWHLDSGAHLATHQLNDVSGITVSSDGQTFIVSSSTGEVRQLDCTTLEELPSRRRRLDGVRWDNHLITVTAGGLL